MSNPIITEVVEQMEYLPDNLQQQVLEFVYKLKTSISPGVSGKKLLRFAGAIPLADLEQISQAIQRDCERVDLDEW